MRVSSAILITQSMQPQFIKDDTPQESRTEVVVYLLQLCYETWSVVRPQSIIPLITLHLKHNAVAYWLGSYDTDSKVQQVSAEMLVPESHK
jgi:hypothetical protein